MSRTATQKGKCTRGGTAKGKTVYWSVDQARHDAAALNTVSDGGRPMVAYHCDYCGLWHIGHARREGDPNEPCPNP